MWCSVGSNASSRSPLAALTKAADFTCDRRIRLSALDQVTLDEVAAGLGRLRTLDPSWLKPAR